ncbi:adenosylmethionine--8-amino-7-oxononanoate transaminase [Flavobacteriaceae bacterium 14752]|uniref:adenosylmethionine--8-amino-7-oxononanoate transaminase n=1 Tax=Mesohalobacter salilacus TaxID=2491711 RepID=UPI000F63C725|nr:adenosylmethionine--8-amino-7-oxononanoate transaminase [Flavobacteriaceae bacterium 14752]
MSKKNNSKQKLKSSLSQRDKSVIWHPLTQHKTQQSTLPIVKAKGCKLYDEAGNDYIDAISSWYTAVYGHCHKKLVKAIQQQSQQLDQIIFSGFTHQPAVELAENLLAVLPVKISKVFYNDNGSTATEIGIKMALQYHHNLGHDRDTLIAFEEGFHGDTFGAMSVSGLSVYNGAYKEHFIKVVRLPKPNGKNNQNVLTQLKTLCSENKIAGFIYEPLIQGAAGMKTYDKTGLNEILKFCKTQYIICIADEVMTGFGKTGTCFASEQIETQPDVICLSKALTAGMLPMGITACQDFIYDAFYDDDVAKGLFHAHTYSGNPLACAVAIEALKLYQSPEIQQQIQHIIEAHQSFKTKIENHPNLKSVRHIGVILALDLDLNIERYSNVRDRLYKFFMDKGIYLRPLGHTVYIVPPYVISREDLSQVYQALEDVLEFEF